MSFVIQAYKNILETAAAISIEIGAADADFPITRLYDRRIGELFKAQAASTLEILFKQGVDVVTNGTFDADSDWTKGTGWTIAAGVASASGAAALSDLFQQNIAAAEMDELYFVSYEIKSRTQGTLQLFLDSVSLGPVRSAVGKYYELIRWNGNNKRLRFRGASNFIGSIDNVSAVKASDVIEIDQLLIPGGHNLNWETLQIQYSRDNVDYYTAAADIIPSDTTSVIARSLLLNAELVTNGDFELRNPDDLIITGRGWTDNSAVFNPDTAVTPSGSGWFCFLPAIGAPLTGIVSANPILVDITNQFTISFLSEVYGYIAGNYIIYLDEYDDAAGTSLVTSTALIDLTATTPEATYSSTFGLAGSDIVADPTTKSVRFRQVWEGGASQGVGTIDSLSMKITTLTPNARANWWKFIVLSPSVTPELTELFLTDAYQWSRNPSRPTGPLDQEHNVRADQDAAGRMRYVEFGDPKELRSYSLPNIDEAQKDELVALNNTWLGKKPFYLKDHEGVWIFGRLASRIDLTEILNERYSAVFDFIEELP
jgi:hypothetical protein